MRELAHPCAPEASPISADLQNSVVVSRFNAGVRIVHIVDGPSWHPNAPPHLEQIGYYIRASLPGDPGGAPQMNHAIVVVEHGLIYDNDRITGGPYILRYVGKVPLN